MPTIMGLDVGTDNPKRLAGRLTVEFILAALYYYLCIKGPLWPIHRLRAIIDGPVSCITEGIRNANADWWASIGALCCLFAAPFLYWGEGPYVVNTILAGVMLMFYVGITAMVFEDGLMRGLSWCGEVAGAVYDWVVIAFWIVVVTAAHVRDERPAYELDPEVRRANSKQRVFVIVGMLFLVTSSLAAVWVGYEYLSSLRHK